MNAEARATVAYVIGRVMTGSGPAAIYDHTRRRRVSIGGTVDASRVNVYDYDRQCFLAGERHDGEFTLYDHGRRQRVSIRLSGELVTGFDHATGTHFQGRVSAAAVQLFDAETGKFHAYSL